ncbi:hypothetical protein H4R18_003403 [Coemansia javaensis]|uniref:Oxidized purine nucleoside triphosphate hydrolase n=1 Tax=Coemansia javaensis TaxID=2761396 RepID=A0A9W8LIH0_9FUNG|nr:hypothetical protein H4R18_003403 [Coemansia javaensis]
MDPRSVARHVESDADRAAAHRLYTLVFPVDAAAGRVLLGMKKRGFGRGKLNGFGGKVEAGETVAQGAVRELAEESGLAARSVEQCGLLLFYFEGDPTAMEVHVFQARDYAGAAAESDEMRPEWFPVDQMPFDRMWADDRFWWPCVVDGAKFVGRFWFKADQTTIVRQSLVRVDSLDFGGAAS